MRRGLLQMGVILVGAALFLFIMYAARGANVGHIYMGDVIDARLAKMNIWAGAPTGTQMLQEDLDRSARIPIMPLSEPFNWQQAIEDMQPVPSLQPDYMLNLGPRIRVYPIIK